MTPEERQLLTGLFDRIRDQSNAPRDREVESFIAEAVRAQPYAPYLLTQAVIVQDHALQAANQRLQQLEARLQELESTSPAQQQAGGSFLGAIGRSLFGGEPPHPPQGAPPVPPTGPWGQTAPRAPQPYYEPPGQSAYAPAPQSPWGGAPQAGPVGGGFLQGALGSAAGVAGGVLLADSIRGLFSGGSNPLGMGSGLGGGGLNPGGSAGGETTVNNYYDAPQDQQPDDLQNAADDDGSGNQDPGYDDSQDGSGGDDSYNV